MARKIKSKVTDDVASSFTSMIDIVFLLLIFFILQPFKETELKLEANLPMDGAPASQDPVEPKVDIKVLIMPGKANPNTARYVIDGTEVGNSSPATYRKLAVELQTRSNGDTDAPVSIFPMPEVNFEYVLRVLDACYKARLPNVRFGFGN